MYVKIGIRYIAYVMVNAMYYLVFCSVHVYVCAKYKKSLGRPLVGRNVIIPNERAHTDEVAFLDVFMYEYRTQ